MICTKRILSLLLTVILLMGMTASAYAEIVGGITGPVNCKHNWQWRWPNGQPSNCQDWKVSEEYCTKCGATGASYEQCGPCKPGAKTWIIPQPTTCQEQGVWEISCVYCGEWLDGAEISGSCKGVTNTIREPGCDNTGMKQTVCAYCGSEMGDPVEIPALGHIWSAWSWAHGAPSCEESAWQVRNCTRCGRMEDRWVQGTSHKWGEWKVFEEATCTEAGVEHRQCAVCGDYWTRELAALGHEMGEWTVVKQPADGEYGLKERKCVRCDYTEQEEIPYSGEIEGETDVPVNPVPDYPPVTLTMSETSSPGNGKFYVPGEAVNYLICLTVPEGPVIGHTEICIPIEGTNNRSVVAILFDAPAGEYNYTVERIVTEADAEKGFVSNYASATFLDSVKDEWAEISSNEVVVLAGEEIKLDGPGLDVTLTITSTPANGTHYVLDEEIHYDVSVTNLTNLTLYDVKYGITFYSGIKLTKGTAETIAAGEKLTVSGVFKVTQLDVDNGSWTESPWASAFARNAAEELPLVTVGNPVSVPCQEEGGLVTTLEILSTPANGEYYIHGESVHARVIVTNTSNKPYTDVRTCISYGSGFFFTDNRADKLLPGESFTDEDIVPMDWKHLSNQTIMSGIVPFTGEGMGDNTDGRQEMSYSDSISVRIGKPDNPILLQIEVLSAPQNGMYYEVGEKVSYRVTAENVSSSTLIGIQLAVKAGIEVDIGESEGHFRPGEVISAEGEIEVTEANGADLEAMQMGAIGVAKGQYEDFDDLRIETGPVFVPCASYNDDIDGDGIPNGEDPDIDGDGIPNEEDPDMDGDGIPNEDDPDKNGNGVPDDEEFAYAYLEKSVISVPANEGFYVPGETVSYSIRLVVPEGVKLTDVEITDPIKGRAEDQILDIIPEATGEGNYEYTFDYVVTDDDLMNGFVSNTASAYFFDAEGDAWVRINSNEVVVQVSLEEEAKELFVHKKVLSAPANGEYFTVGEEVLFEITVSNETGVHLPEVGVKDFLDEDWISVFAGGMPDMTASSVVFPYVVTDMDAAEGGVSNSAYANGIDEEGNQFVGYSNDVFIPCGFDGGNDPMGFMSDFAIVKAEESLPLNGSHYTEGETIYYRITYTNAGEIMLYDVCIFDSLAGAEDIASAEALQPGESRNAFFQYTVTAEDVKTGFVSNMASASFTVNGVTGYATSNLVISDTNGNKDDDGYEYVDGGLIFDPIGSVIIDTPFGVGEIPDGGSEPPYGAIDTEPFKNDTDHCYRVIRGMGADYAEYDVVFCTDHADTHQMIEMMLASSGDQDKLLKTYEYAASLWMAELDEMVQKLISAADSTASANVLNEHLAFIAQVGNLEAAVRAMYPDDPVLAEKKVSELLREKVYDLCYTLATAPAGRGDSLLAVSQSQDKKGDNEAACVSAAKDKDGLGLSETDVYCAYHAVHVKNASIRLDNTTESWQKEFILWNAELSNAYNAVYQKTGAEKGVVWMVERSMFENMLENRAKCLMALYPDNPEIAAEAMVRALMDQVNSLCALAE